ncbi:MAG TPA: delta-60 repeat domain-containing protein, partial [Tepidisphaeraceae bacterium]
MPIRTPRAVRQSNSNIHQRIRSAIEALESRLLLSAGDPDPSFGSAGKVQLPGTAGETNYRINAVAVQSDGKTLLAGSAGTYDTGNQGQFFLERLSADGTPDAGFGTGGIVLTGFSNLAVANAIAVQADGKIVLGGMDETTLSGLYDGDAQFAMARFNADGTPDAGFGTSGKVLTRIPGREQVSSLSIAPDGKIVAAGLGTYQDPAHPSDANYASPIFAVARYTTSG